MKIFAPKENDPIETRAALDPTAAKKLVDLGAEVLVESGLGARCDHPDADYAAAGAAVVTDRAAALASADLVLRVRKPSAGEVAALKAGAIHISFLDPFNEAELIAAFAGRGVSAISLEMIPRTTLAQKMDAISSQANLAGYVAVVLAANRLGAIFPMMMTPAGTISPAKVFVLGIGVAGLQAIATAKRLGARVTAFDVRPEALEQAESLGAKALRIDLGETGGTDQGYARELSPEQLEKQRAAQAKVCAESDVVITTAKVFGRRPPVLVKADVVAGMKPGSVVVDLAAEGGGNVEGVVPGEETVTGNGVKLIGLANYEGLVAKHATQVLAANFANMIEHFWDKEAKAFRIDPADEIQKGCLITHGGEVVHERFKS
jgi:NAD(P) transhydrogenase subunit alpha